MIGVEKRLLERSIRSGADSLVGAAGEIKQKVQVVQGVEPMREDFPGLVKMPQVSPRVVGAGLASAICMLSLGSTV